MPRKLDLHADVKKDFTYYSTTLLRRQATSILKIPGVESQVQVMKKRLSGRLAKKAAVYGFAQSRYFRVFAYHCWVCERFPMFWDKRPTVAEFKREVLAFKKHTKNRPNIIPDLANFMEKKYSNLLHVSDEYGDWVEWLHHPQLHPWSWKHFANDDHSHPQEAIDFADAILAAIPQAASQGRPTLAAQIWIARHLKTLWRTTGHDPLSSKANRQQFIFHLEMVLKTIGREPAYSVQLERNVFLALEGKPHTGRYRTKQPLPQSQTYLASEAWELSHPDQQGIASFTDLSRWDLAVFYTAKICFFLKAYGFHKALFYHLYARHTVVLLHPLSRHQDRNGANTQCKEPT